MKRQYIFTYTLAFSDCLAELETLKISYTYLGCFEGKPSLLTKRILQRENEKKKGKNGYLVLEQNSCNDVLGNYRFEIDFIHRDDDFYYLMTVVFFEETVDVNVQEVVNSKIQYINLKDHAEKHSWDDL